MRVQRASIMKRKSKHAVIENAASQTEERKQNAEVHENFEERLEIR
jgi:hypothetical protein